jgi:uncharacterized membrane protein
MQEKLEEDGFWERLVFSDEATFHVNGKVNRRNVRIWGVRQAVETVAVDTLHRVWGELDCRLGICRVTRGAHIEHL